MKTEEIIEAKAKAHRRVAKRTIGHKAIDKNYTDPELTLNG